MPPKILVVEDNTSDIFLLRRALSRQGEPFVLEVLLDGECAIQFVQAQRQEPRTTHPCVILLDLHLPRHDGFEVLNAIRQEPALDHINVMIMTTAASPRQAQELSRLGLPYRLKPKDYTGYELLAADILALCKSHDTLTASGA